jgi:uncharacterized protein (DUF58 family)
VAKKLRLTLTPRGTGLVVGGAVLALAGIGLRLADVVIVGITPLVAVGATAAWMRLLGVDRGRGALTTIRRATPDPVVRGQATRVELSVRPVRASAAAATQLARTRVAENLATELATHPPRGTQHTGDDEIRLTYTLRPTVRGRWPLGPATATIGDPFGLVRTTRPFGSTTLVTVWPATVPLPVRASRSLGVISDTASGARTASTDDAVLREYVPGDDPRRVHWASAARRGQLMVRSDEGAGMPPVTVLYDRGLLPAHVDGRADGLRSRGRGEWSVECCASVVTSLVGAGHAGRVVASSLAAAVATVPHAPGGRGEGIAAVLDQCVDLRGLRDAAEAERALVATAEALRMQRHPDEVMFAVLAPQRSLARTALAGLAEEGYHGAIVVVPRGASSSQRRDAAESVEALRAAGWRAVAVDEGMPFEHVWIYLVEEAS